MNFFKKKQKREIIENTQKVNELAEDTPQSKIEYFENEIKPIQQELEESLIIKDAGLTVHTPGELSKGCQCCKNGTWLCIFVGYHCNTRCASCPQENSQMTDHSKSFVNMWIDDAKKYIDLFPNLIKGVSYSGGEPFMYLDKVKSFAEFLNKEHPNIYQWIYTNGLLVTEDSLIILNNLGVKEIRFHLQATDYSEEILEKIKYASRIMDKVTVEVPCVPETYKYLIEKKIIHQLEELGVTQLNLAELYVNDSNKENYKKEKKYLHNSAFTQTLMLFESRKITYKIIKYAIENKIKILVNDCSQDTKMLQIMKKSTNPILSKIN